MSPVVVAHVVSSLQIGGAERVALELASGQMQAHHRAMVVSLGPLPDGPLEEVLRARWVAVHHVPKPSGTHPWLSLRLAALFRRERVTVVHTHNRLPLVYGAAAGRLAGAVVVHTRHGPRRGTRRQELLGRGAGRLVDAYVAVSRELADQARTLRDCAPEKVSVIENGIDVGRFTINDRARREARAALGIPQDAWVVGSVGRLAPGKDYPLLVRAAAPLLGPHARLIIVGDGSDAAGVRAEVAAHAVQPYVLLPGSRQDVPHYLAALDAFALSSHMEGLPLVVLEAMAAGLPVVATSVGGLTDVITHGWNGFLVSAGDEEGLRRHLEILRADRAMAGVIGARGQAHAWARYSREAMVSRYLDLYSRLGSRPTRESGGARALCASTSTP